MMNYHIYTIFNVANGKIYVGKTKNLIKRWDKHIKVSRGFRKKDIFYIHRAIIKYGLNNFVFSKLQSFHSDNECLNAEKYWISYYNSNNFKYGYNQTNGGEGVSGRFVSEETKQKIREKATGRKHTEETLKLMSGDNNHSSKVSQIKVNEIRNIANNYTFVELSKIYNISAKSIARIIYNVDWYDENYIIPKHRYNTKRDK